MTLGRRNSESDSKEKDLCLGIDLKASRRLSQDPEPDVEGETGDTQLTLRC